MAEWLVEEGIGEERAVQLVDGRIAAARMRWPGRIAQGAVAEAVVMRRFPQTANAIVRFATGEEAFGRRLPRSDSEGATVRMQIEREAIAESGRLKRAQAVKTDAPLDPAPSLADSLARSGETVRVVRRFPPESDWNDLWFEAWSGEVPFHGGSLLFADTPAMTVIDVDGAPPEAIGYNAVPALASALRRFDLAGNIGIDFPTLADKGDRRAVDGRLSDALADWPHERTAMNGFGFVQIVARLGRASLLRLITRDRPRAAARFLLRQAEGLDGAGDILLMAHPGVMVAMGAGWLDVLERRMGRAVRTIADPTLALEGGHAQIVPR